jgi:hypothetical protein
VTALILLVVGAVAGALAAATLIAVYVPAGTVWICGQVTDAAVGSGIAAWEFQGAYSTEQLARAACRDATYFIGPATIDDVGPDDVVDWIGAYYPLFDPKCIRCGCTEDHACEGGCSWASTDPPICSRCA